jgi:hypothetical protein
MAWEPTTSDLTSSPASRWPAVLGGLIWRLLVVVLLPVTLPSQAQIGAAQGSTQQLMVGVVAGLAGVAFLGLPLGLWRRPGLLGSCYRVAAAAVAVRLTFPGPTELMATTWIAALGVAFVDGLYAAGAGLADRRAAARAPVPSEPDPEPTYVLPPSPQQADLAGHALPYPARRPGRPVMAWLVAPVGVLGIVALAWTSNADLRPGTAPSLTPPALTQPQGPPATSQPRAPATARPQAPPTTAQPQTPAPGQAQAPPAPPARPAPSPPGRGGSVCAQVGGSSVCIQEPPIAGV